MFQLPSFRFSLAYRLGSFAVQLSLLLVFMSQVGSGTSQQCQKLDQSLANSCGYDQTVKFRQSSRFTHAASLLTKSFGQLGGCSKLTNLLFCSIRLPRCEEDLHGPYLPCRGVCQQWAQDCRDEIAQQGLEWILAYCGMLPQHDDPETTDGYLGRCFTPANFQPTQGK